MSRAGLLWCAGGSAGLALYAGWRDRRRRARHDLDRVEVADWPTVQVLAMMAVAILVSLAFNVDG